MEERLVILRNDDKHYGVTKSVLKMFLSFNCIAHWITLLIQCREMSTSY